MPSYDYNFLHNSTTATPQQESDLLTHGPTTPGLSQRANEMEEPGLDYIHFLSSLTLAVGPTHRPPVAAACVNSSFGISQHNPITSLLPPQPFDLYFITLILLYFREREGGSLLKICFFFLILNLYLI
jgi:hypothetical protein